jgi:hypothetical protein
MSHIDLLKKESYKLLYSYMLSSCLLYCIVLYCIYFGPRNPEDIGQVNVQQYKPQNN